MRPSSREVWLVELPASTLTVTAVRTRLLAALQPMAAELSGTAVVRRQSAGSLASLYGLRRLVEQRLRVLLEPRWRYRETFVPHRVALAQLLEREPTLDVVAVSNDSKGHGLFVLHRERLGE